MNTKLTASVALLAAMPFLSTSPALAHAHEAGALAVEVGVGASLGASADGAGADADLIVITQSDVVDTSDLIEGVTISDETSAVVAASSSVQASVREALIAHARAVARNDAHVSAVALSSQEVAVTYQLPAKLLGFISVSMPVQVRIDAQGDATVRYPWYRFLLDADQGLKTRAQAAADNSLAARASATTTLSTEAQARLLDSLHALMRAEAELRADADIEAGS